MRIKLDDFNLERELKINKRVDLKVDSGRFEGEFYTQIVDVEDEDTFVINAPFKKGEVVNLGVNKKAEVIMRRDDGIYSLPVKVVSRRKDTTPLLVLKLRDSVYKIQERQFFRLAVFEKTEFRIVGKGLVNLYELESYSEAVDSYEGVIEDISGGGIKLSTQKKVSREEVIEFKLDFADLSFDTAFGQVVRMGEEMKGETQYYLLGVEFIDLNKSYQEELISWLFTKQRELRNKGLI